MARYIDADALKKCVNDRSTHWLNGWDTLGVLAVVDEQPTADVREERRGHWTHDDEGNAVCSYCNGKSKEEFAMFYSFCPECGAIMGE